MTREEKTARHQLEALAVDGRGRQLLQLALRGIQTSGRGLTIGCWVKPGGGVAGCVFQHAYWQGVDEGLFETTATANKEIKHLVAERDFHLVMEAIRALDTLGKRRFMRRQGLQRTLDEAAWRDTVERLLVDALAEHAAAPDRSPVPA
ncbi:MAG: hypothetical protein JO321_16370 [Solirubrobacterales bacterium]|nr:hypothetical protein [Solirubrobacterales bacterium]MBV9166433.1 hypothetical protein [Solirubrobacterales bacterium]MBV9536974.1 hypothetical protein [Solirubrobacterales bacterium]